MNKESLAVAENMIYISRQGKIVQRGELLSAPSVFLAPRN